MSCCTLTKGVKCQGSESHSPPSQILAAVNNQSSSSPRSSHRNQCAIQQFNTISIWKNKSFSATLYSERASSIGHCSPHGFPFCHHCCLRAFQHLWLSSRSSSWLQWWCFHWCHCRDCGCGQCSCDQKNTNRDMAIIRIILNSSVIEVSVCGRVSVSSVKTSLLARA